ncbi:MAG: hypothetical protein WCK29_02670 [archaeon]
METLENNCSTSKAPKIVSKVMCQNVFSSFMGGLAVGSTLGTASAGISLMNIVTSGKYLDMVRGSHFDESNESYPNQPKRVEQLDKAYVIGRTIGQAALGTIFLYGIINSNSDGGM